MTKDALASAFLPIVKSQKNDDGTLTVRGLAADPTLDIDNQVCDPGWLKTAMPKWFEWGNIREQHSNVAAGVATALEATDAGQHYVEAKIVDPNSIKKVEAGVLKGFSIGIRRPIINRDKSATGGRFVGGEIVEVSLVDRPANPNCRLSLVKSAGTDDGALEPDETLTEDGEPAPPADASASVPTQAAAPEGQEPASGAATTADVEKVGKTQAKRNVKRLNEMRQFIDDMLAEVVSSGGAEGNQADTSEAAEIVLSPSALLARAAALVQEFTTIRPDKAEDLKAATVVIVNKSVHQEPTMRAVLRGITTLIAQEAAEAADGKDEESSLRCLLDLYSCFKCFWMIEQREGEVGTMRGPVFGDLIVTPIEVVSDMRNPGGIGEGAAAAYLGAGADATPDADATKAANGDEQKPVEDPQPDITKTVTDAVTAALQPVLASNKALEERLDKVEKQAAPGGPKRSSGAAPGSGATQADVTNLLAQAEQYDKMATTTHDRRLAAGYTQIAIDKRAEADKVKAAASA